MRCRSGCGRKAPVKDELFHKIAGGHIMLRLITVLALLIGALPANGLAATTSMRFLYPSFSGTWAVPWIAKEAGYLNAEGLDVELIRVGGSTRMVAALLGGSAPLIHAGAPAAFAASVAGSDVVIIAAIGSMSPFRLMARPEIKQPADLKGKKAGITTFRFDLRPDGPAGVETFRTGAKQRCRPPSLWAASRKPLPQCRADRFRSCP